MNTDQPPSSSVTRVALGSAPRDFLLLWLGGLELENWGFVSQKDFHSLHSLNDVSVYPG